MTWDIPVPKVLDRDTLRDGCYASPKKPGSDEEADGESCQSDRANRKETIVKQQHRQFDEWDCERPDHFEGIKHFVILYYFLGWKRRSMFAQAVSKANEVANRRNPGKDLVNEFCQGGLQNTAGLRNQYTKATMIT